MKKKKTKFKKIFGFTLPEVLISVGLFSIIIAITSSVFLISLRSQRHIIAAINANDNLSFALEVMARDIRTGTMFFSPLNEEISFLNYRNRGTIYRLNNETIEKSVGGGSFNALTSNNIRITKLNFILSGEKRYDGQQTRVTVIMRAISRFGNQEIIKDVQTTISPRNLEDI